MQYNFAERVLKMESSDIRRLMKIITNPNVISFGAGSPAIDLFPIEELKKASELVYADRENGAFQYSSSEGYDPLKKWIIDRYNFKNNSSLQKNNVLITNGSQQGLDLVGKIFLNKDDIVLCENPTYTSALAAFRSYECKFQGIRTDSEGMIIDEVEHIIERNKNIKLIYIIPNYQNPTGITWSIERRRAIVELASKYNIIILEDDPYGELGFEESSNPSLKKFDYSGLVITLGSFSKILCPGLRTGWIIANEEVITKLIYAKQATDLQSNEIIQQQIANYLFNYDFEKHLSKLKNVYKKRCCIACDIIDDIFPKTVKYLHPSGGFFLWLNFPEEFNTKDLLVEAVDRGVAYVPGHSFYPKLVRYNNMRLNYSSMSEEKLIQGLEILGAICCEKS